MQVNRPQKAHTWYLDNGLPWRHTSPGMANEDSYSLFGDAACRQQHQTTITNNYNGYSGSAASSSREEIDTSYGSETDDEFFYVSCQQLTRDDLDMPEVIAVRKSSVELIKWQNSLRRRRRRQAKRHDLGRSKKRETLPASAANTV
nr:hypothetical protein BaRGS_006353 [Batillaria attramentaria]